MQRVNDNQQHSERGEIQHGSILHETVSKSSLRVAMVEGKPRAGRLARSKCEAGPIEC
jgi:hypothetical protein